MLPTFTGPLPASLQQQAEKAAQRLERPLTSLSIQQQAVLAFSDFVADSLLQHLEWWRQLTELPPQPDEWRHYAD